MGRVYAVDPGPGERDGAGYRVFNAAGNKIPFVYRVELDADADEGAASVFFFVADEKGSPFVDDTGLAVCKASTRAWVRVRPRGAPDPGPVNLWKNSDGTVTADADPVPAVPFAEEING